MYSESPFNPHLCCQTLDSDILSRHIACNANMSHLLFHLQEALAYLQSDTAETMKLFEREKLSLSAGF